MKRELLSFLAGPAAEVSELNAQLRLLSVKDTLRAVSRLEDMEQRGVDHAGVYFIARVLAMALYRDGKRLFDGPDELMEALSPQMMGQLAETYAGLLGELSDHEHLQALKQALKNCPQERDRWAIMRRLGLTPVQAGEMSRGELLYCRWNLELDDDEQAGFNPYFDEKRAEPWTNC